MANKALEHVLKIVAGGDYDFVILDVINVSLDWKHIELVLTCGYASQEIIEVADLVTEMQELKHRYNDGVEARDGIEH